MPVRLKQRARRVCSSKNPQLRERVAAILRELAENETTRESLQAALTPWHAPRAAEQIASRILKSLGEQFILDAPDGEKVDVRGGMNLKVVA